jgi:hypothetical protein
VNHATPRPDLARTRNFSQVNGWTRAGTPLVQHFCTLNSRTGVHYHIDRRKIGAGSCTRPSPRMRPRTRRCFLFLRPGGSAAAPAAKDSGEARARSHGALHGRMIRAGGTVTEECFQVGFARCGACVVAAAPSVAASRGRPLGIRSGGG